MHLLPQSLCACEERLTMKAAKHNCIVHAVFFAAAAMLLGGCSQDLESLIPGENETEVWVPTATAVDVHEDGSLRETIIDILDQSYYSADELQAMIESTLAEFNQDAGSTLVSAASIDLTDGQVNVVLDYADGASFAAYNQVSFFSGSMLSAQLEGFLFDMDFRTVTEEGASSQVITNEEPLSHKEYQVVVADTGHRVHVPGVIRYVSANAAISDIYTAVPLSDYEDGSAEEITSDGQRRTQQTYMYIIYEDQ